MKVLLLAGTGEAKKIAWGLTDSGISVQASLAGATRRPEPLPVPTRIGGFGGEAAFRSYLAEQGITAVLDATHPFANRMTDRTARLCSELGLPYAQVLRPPWVPQRGDNWTEIDRPQDVKAHVADDATIFLATGRQTLAEFENLSGRRILARLIDPPTSPFPFEGGEFIVGRPPFTVESEIELFNALNVSHLVVKNAGGQGGFAKIEAARVLGLSVLMIKRPPMPDADRVTTVQEALEWVKAL